MQHCHQKDVAHRDIKLENMLLDADYKLKVADFGLSGHMRGRFGEGVLKTHVGTEGLKAPEILAGESYKGDEVDLFALGVSLFTMVVGFPPFNEADIRADLFYKGLIRKPQIYWRKISQRCNNRNFSDDLKALIGAMLQPDPKDRLSMQEIFVHPFMKGPIPSEQEVRTTMSQLTAA